MKKRFYILFLGITVLSASCRNDIFPELIYPSAEQEFPRPDGTYSPGDADGLTTAASQIKLPETNAKTYYVDGANPGAQTTVCYSGQSANRLLDGEAKVQNAGNQWQITTTSPGADATATTVDVVVEIPDGTVFDYMMIVNRNYANGFPFQYELFYATTASPATFTSQGIIKQVANPASPANPGNTDDYNAYAQRIAVPGTMTGNIAKVKLRIKYSDCNAGTAICLREIEFWKNGEAADIPDCFSDRSCSALKAGTTQADIDGISSPFFKNLAQAVYDGIYDMHRVVAAAPMADPATAAADNKNSLPYSKLHYMTGVYASVNETIVVLAEGVTGEAYITIFGMNKATAAATQSVKLNNGINSIPSANAGTIYVTNTDPAQTGLKVNVANGFMNGVYDVSKHSASNLPFILSRAKSGANIDLIGKNTMLTVAVDDVAGYCADPSAVLDIYDRMVEFQQDFSGMEKNTTKLHYVETSQRGNMMFVANWGEFHPKHIRYMLEPEALKDTLTEFAQMTAMVNVPAGFTWASVNTAPANRYLFAAATQEHLGLPSHLAADPTQYGLAFRRYFIDKATHAATGTAVYGKINSVPLWQLHLYLTNVKGKTGFYTDVLKALREGTLNTAANFAKVACEKSGYNLTGFFNKWGYALPANFETNNLTPAIIANVPSDALEYISDATVGLYKNPASVSAGASYYSVSEEFEYTFDFSACRNAVAYEVLVDGTAEYISVIPEFAYARTSATGTVTANAIGTNGSKTAITVSKR